MGDFLIILLAFMFGFLSCAVAISVFILIWFWKTIISLSGSLNKKEAEMDSMVASALEEGYNISQEQKLFMVNLN